MDRTRKIIGFAGAVGLAVGLAGCKYQDAPDPVDFKPGVYQGQTDEKLTDEQVKALRERGNTAY